MTERSYHQRRSIRLKDYDYSHEGAYFVTICAHEHTNLFGHISNGVMISNRFGQIIMTCWEQISSHFKAVELDAFTLMPNHLHGIIVITDANHVGATHGSPTFPQSPEFSPIAKPVSLGTIIGQFKSTVTRQLKQSGEILPHPIWQRNYYEHIIGNNQSLNTIRAYIATNPEKWQEDRLFRA